MISPDTRLTPASPTSLNRPLHSVSTPSSATSVNFRQGDFHDTLAAILRRKWLIIAIVVIATSAVAIRVLSLPSIYEAVGTLRLEPKS
ncbi:MAG: hypothetical protein ABJC05_05520, partial [Pyrinomonadaceae bacterium]